MRLKKLYSLFIFIVILLSGVTFTVQSTAQDIGETVAQTPEYNLVISSNTALHQNLFAANLTINSGVTLCTDGYSIILSGNFENFGSLQAGHNYQSTHSNSNSVNYSDSIGGSGGGTSFNPTAASAYQAGSTMAAAGTAKGYHNGENGQAVSFSTAVGYATLSNISKWFKTGIQQYLSGAAGGSVCGRKYGFCNGGMGSYGIYIQANTVHEGKIMASGLSSNCSVCQFGMPGAGGGGAVIIAYGNGGLVPGQICNSGGNATPKYSKYCFSGGQGGNGTVLTLNYKEGQMPVPVTINIPQWAHDGSTVKYEDNCSQIGPEGDFPERPYYITQTITNVNVPLQKFELVNTCGGDKPKDCTLYFNHPYNMLAINSTDLNDANSGKLPENWSIECFGIQGLRNPSIITKMVITVNSGTYITDELRYSMPEYGIQIILWVSQSSGVIIKLFASITDYCPSYSYKRESTVILIGTNIPMNRTDNYGDIVLSVMFGGVIGVIIFSYYIAKRDDYDNSRRFHKSITNAGKSGDSSNDTTRPLREVSNSGFIQKEDIDDRLKDEDSEK